MDLFVILDAISEFIFIPKKFRSIIDSAEMQRLRRIKQLTGAEYVYPGANHTRFEHSLGVMANVQKLLEILRNGKDVEIEQSYFDSAVLGGLCHDIGHAAFSHNFEEIMMSRIGRDHEDFTRWIIKESEIGDKIDALGLDKNIVSSLATGSLENSEYPFLNQVIAGAIDSDQMDYLERDSYHCGLSTSASVLKQRLMTLVDIMPTRDMGYNIKGVATLESFLISRLNAFRTIYFHKTCRAIQLMLGDAIRIYADETDEFKFKTPEDYLKWDDITLYYNLLHHEKTNKIMDRINRRDIIKMCYEQPSAIIKGEEKPKTGNAQKLRKRIAEKAGLYPEEVWIDFPLMASVPYQHSTNLKRQEIPVFSIDNEGNMQVEDIEEHSLFYEQMKGHYNIVRVYSDKKNKPVVHDAAKKILRGHILDDWF